MLFDFGLLAICIQLVDAFSTCSFLHIFMACFLILQKKTILSPSPYSVSHLHAQMLMQMPIPLLHLTHLLDVVMSSGAQKAISQHFL